MRRMFGIEVFVRGRGTSPSVRELVQMAQEGKEKASKLRWHHLMCLWELDEVDELTGSNTVIIILEVCPELSDDLEPLVTKYGTPLAMYVCYFWALDKSVK